MKRIMLFGIMLFLISLLSGCFIFGEILMPPPDEMEIPEDSLIAVCTVDEDIHTYIYKGDGIYQYFINDELQGDEEIDIIQEQAFINGESMDNYLRLTYEIGQCVIEDYYESLEE